MTALIIVGIVLSFIAAYFGIGAALARRDLPRSIAANIGPSLKFSHYEYPSIKRGPVYKNLGPEEVDRPAVKAEQARMLWLWPVIAPARAWRHSLESRIDRYDPAVTRALEAELAQLKTHIEKLEADL